MPIYLTVALIVQLREKVLALECEMTAVHQFFQQLPTVKKYTNSFIYFIPILRYIFFCCFQDLNLFDLFTRCQQLYIAYPPAILFITKKLKVPEE
jgi:hypothetical protein